MDRLKAARETRKAMMMTAETYTDERAAKVPTLYPVWAEGETVAVGDRRYRPEQDKLYKAVQAHTTQEGREPENTPALWSVIDVIHAGTADDPIPASRGMEYTYGLYYLDPEDGLVYLCARAGAVDGETVTLQYLPHELVGQYFEVA